jgi:MAP/microtubule affinity-regulating kinase
MSLPRKSEDIIITEGLLNYTIKKILGKGAYATVRLAQHNETSKKVAIKTYDKYQIIDPTKRANMLREIEILKKLDHPNIIKLYETVDTPKHFHLVLEYVSGLSLYTYIKSKPNSCLDENEAKRIFKQILGALDYCHCRFIAHRDIKLDNILLDEKSNVKIIDFGFSTMNSNDEKSRVFCGTPSYMAPEIVGRKDYYGMQADVWALGILLYAMLCGKMPFKAYNDKELYRRIEKGNFTLPNTVPESFRKVISKMLEVNPKKRPSIKALLDDEWPSSGGNNNWNMQNYVSRSTCETNSLDLEIISGIVNYN